MNEFDVDMQDLGMRIQELSVKWSISESELYKSLESYLVRRES